jgi:hypothetical protein
MEANELGFPGLATVGCCTAGRGPVWRSQLLHLQRFALNPSAIGASVNSHSFTEPLGNEELKPDRRRACVQPRNLG